MFRLCKTVHSKTPLLLLSSRNTLRYVNFRVRPEDDDTWKKYRADMEKLRYYCREENKAERKEKMRKQAEYDERFSWEYRFADALKYAAEINAQQQAKREATKREKSKIYETKMEEVKEKNELKKVISKERGQIALAKESEIGQTYITPKNIEILLDDALDNPISTNFAFPNDKIVGDGKGEKNFDEDGEVILHEVIPYIG